MGVMEKMRQSTGVILWILIFSFGVLWILADTNFFDAIQQGPRSLGQVNGDAISLEEYNSRVSYYSQQYSQQTGNSMTPEMRTYYEEQAWNDLVTSRLLQQKMDELGIAVTDQEVVDMITGPNPDPFIRQQFQGEDGQIDRVALQAAIESPENSEIWLTIEQQLRQNRRQQKMSNFMQAAMAVSNLEVERKYVRDNTTADFTYVRFPYSGISDEEVSVTDQELRTWYNNNSDDYERSRSYEFRYVSFDKTPTAEDTARTISDLENLREDFQAAEDDSLFLDRYQTTTPWMEEAVNKDDLRERFRPVLELEEGEVSEVYQNQGQAYLMKKLDETADAVHFAVLSFDITADPIATVDARAEEADDFSYFAEEESFEAEAERRELEISEASATEGNDFVAGLGQSRQILNFLDSAVEGELSQPLELTDRFVVVRVDEIIPEGVRPFEEVREQIRTAVRNKKRRNMMVERVSELLSGADGIEGLAESADREAVTVSSISMNAATIEGAGREPAVVGAIFGLEEGEQSGPIRGNNAVFVVRVNQRNSADPAEMDEQTARNIYQELQQQKNAAFSNVWLEQLKENADIVDNRSRLLQN